ncbi:AraC family transcriptional regulator [Marinobacter orientalis]|uniref:Helix-turn-helix domain-containing protein n=1 Tax=Marinobacter orientalis TaxID=1928859 RepID=A0A7Y0NJM1_9GAMM|nr:helix-turn-helix domain-containing protein [Marinobacter orientalis]NMT62403.1 helix-turn-helix domain-containing protein [Marinobacter orientalis]TGX51105.1 AraC family transcriptional regulator [Marinobacter orientalis]
MPNTVPTLELDAYLRLNRASLGEWLVAIREISGCEDMACRLHRGSGPAGALSALETGQGCILCIYACQGMDITGCRGVDPVLLLPLAGEPEIALRDGRWQPLAQLTFAHPEDRFHMRVPESGRVMILRPKAGSLDNLATVNGGWQLSACQQLIDCYLHRSPFFRDDNHARLMTSELFCQLSRVAQEESIPVCDCSGLDRRLLRAVEKIRREPDWDFNLRELASHAGVSERNLYYLMKREASITPYRLYQRNRLVRVRYRLVDCQCTVPHISWYAADEGFSHLGRFAALYREHFGELPSETVQWRRNLQTVEKEPSGPSFTFTELQN